MISKDRTFSVGQLSEILKACFQNPAFKGIRVYGEVYSIRLGRFSYIEIGDQGKLQTNSPLIKCAFSTPHGDTYGLSQVQVGDVIQVEGDLSYYAHGSAVTLWGNDVSLLRTQMGKTLLARRKTLEKLDRLGYLDPKRKRPIPAYCRRVAIVTAKGSAAYSDMLKTLHGRFPVSTVLFPAVVQGENAARSIVKALKKAGEGDFDCILLGRGGGSKSDLSAFDDEELALAIATSPIPVITCIGHTIDTAIADMVSDVKAITPTEGASLINPSLDEVKANRELFLRQLRETFGERIKDKEMALDGFRQRLEDLSPKRRAAMRLDALKANFASLTKTYRGRILSEAGRASARKDALKALFLSNLKSARDKLALFGKTLESLSKENLAKSGYALVFKDGKKIVSAQELRRGDKAVLTFIDGRKEVEVQ